MASVLVQLAESVKGAINAAGLTFGGQALAAERSYLPRFDLEELGALRVTVVPKGIEYERLDRSAFTEDYVVDVGVQKRVADDAESDALSALAEQIVDHLKAVRLSPGNAALVKVESVPYWPDHLKEMRLFTNVQTLTFRVVR